MSVTTLLHSHDETTGYILPTFSTIFAIQIFILTFGFGVPNTIQMSPNKLNISPVVIATSLEGGVRHVCLNVIFRQNFP